MLKVVFYYYSFVTIFIYMGQYLKKGFEGSGGQVIGKQTLEPWNPRILGPF